MLKLPTKRVYQYITLKDIKDITKQGGIFLKAMYVKVFLKSIYVKERK